MYNPVKDRKIFKRVKPKSVLNKKDNKKQANFNYVQCETPLIIDQKHVAKDKGKNSGNNEKKEINLIKSSNHMRKEQKYMPHGTSCDRFLSVDRGTNVDFAVDPVVPKNCNLWMC